MDIIQATSWMSLLLVTALETEQENGEVMIFC